MSKASDLIEAWLGKANDDYEGFIILSHAEPKLYDLIFFHAQQAVEKWLKAIMVHFDIPPPRTHNLVFLLDQLIDHFPALDDSLWYERARLLNSFAVEVRYPNDPLPREDFVKKFEDIKVVLEFYKQMTNNFFASQPT